MIIKLLKFSVFPLLFIMGVGFFVNNLFVDHFYLIRAWWDLGHVIFFSLFAFVSLYFIKLFSLTTRFLLVASVSMVIGVLIEAVQFNMERDASLSDIAYNLLGILIGIYFYWRWFVFSNPLNVSEVDRCLSNSQQKILNYTSQVLLLCGLLLVLLHPLNATLNWIHSFLIPQKLLVIDKPWKNIRLTPTYSSQLIWKEERAVITFSDHSYAGFELNHFSPNWSNFEQLVLEFNNVNDHNLTLSCRIHDAQHINSYEDRYNETWVFKPGKQTLNLKVNYIAETLSGRQMNMMRVDSIICFSLDKRVSKLHLTKVILK